MCLYVHDIFPLEILRGLLFITMKTKAKQYFDSSARHLLPVTFAYFVKMCRVRYIRA